MKRTPLLRKTTLRQRRVRAEGPTAPREEKPWAVALVAGTVKPLARGSYVGETSAAPKTAPYRDRALLEMALGRACLLLVHGVCNHRQDTTVACHSNLGVHGKAGARKADDCYSCWGCAACHRWLDQGRADAFLKETAFMQAHLSQVLAWRQIAADPAEPLRFRTAALRALERLNASPTGEKP